MNSENERELENEEGWDFEHIQTREPVKSPRVVISVAFRREDFETVSNYAERVGKKISEFVREAALEKAAGRDSTVSVQGFGGAGSLWLGNTLPSTTRAHTLTVERQDHESVVTSG